MGRQLRDAAQRLDTEPRKSDAASVAALASRIDAVTVYRTGARVTRHAELERGAGYPESVTISGLPLALVDSSVRARVLPLDGGAAGLPVAADVRISLDVARGDDELRPADDEELEAARLAVKTQRSLVAQIEREIDRLDHLDLQARARATADQPPPDSPLAARLALLELRDRSWLELGDELEAARQELAGRERRIRELEDSDRRASSARKPREHELRKCAVISLRGGSAAGARLALEYRVPGARWAPAYVARLDRAGTSVDLAVRAMIAQRTGEDWRDAAIRLVTADAETTTELPELHSLRIGRRQAEPARTGWRSPPVGADLLYADYDRAFGGAAPGAPISGESEATGEYDDVITRPAAYGGSDFEEVTAVQASADLASNTARMPAMGAPPQAPPPPAGAVQARPMPAMQAAPAPASSRSTMFSLGGRSADKKRRKGARERSAVVDDAPAELELEGGEAGAESAIRASDELLDYGHLMMASAEAPERGKLFRQGPVAGYLVDLRARSWEVDFDLRGALSSSRAAARAVDGRSPPPGHSYDFPDDYDYSFVAESRLDIPSDGEFHSVALTARPGGCRLIYVVAPRESTDVFRVARIENPLEGPLIAGPIDVYLGGEFLLATRLGFTPPGGTLRFGLGVEQAVKVIRNSQFREDSAGLLGGSRELHHQFRVEAQNHLSRPIDLEVRERVPVIRDDEDDIKVELTAVSPEWEAYEPTEEELGNQNLRGGHRWRVSLDAGGKTELKAGYTIRISSKHELVGGNRRES
jgi:hypothetical protein